MTTSETPYDLALTGGTLLDPGQGIINERRGIAFKDGSGYVHGRGRRLWIDALGDIRLLQAS